MKFKLFFVTLLFTFVLINFVSSTIYVNPNVEQEKCVRDCPQINVTYNETTCSDVITEKSDELKQNIQIKLVLSFILGIIITSLVFLGKTKMKNSKTIKKSTPKITPKIESDEELSDLIDSTGLGEEIKKDYEDIQNSKKNGKK